MTAAKPGTGGINQSTINAAMKYGPLALGGVGAVLQKQAANKASAALGQCRQYAKQRRKYHAPAGAGGRSQSRRRGKNRGMGTERQGSGESPVLRSSCRAWQFQHGAICDVVHRSAGGNDLAQTSIQQSLQTAMQELNITDTNQVAAIKASMASDQSIAQNLTQFMAAYGALNRATATPAATPAA